MRFFSNDTQRSGFMGYIGGLATALAFWGANVDGWPGKVMCGVAALTITYLLFQGNFGGDRS